LPHRRALPRQRGHRRRRRRPRGPAPRRRGQLRRARDPELDLQVLEMLITGIAFGLIGLDLRMIIESEHANLGRAACVGLIIAAVVVAVRFAWLLLGTLLERRRREEDPDAAPLNVRDATLMTWGGMRGLATISLALSIPATTATG